MKYTRKILFCHELEGEAFLEFLMKRISGRSPGAVMEAIEQLRSDYSEHWDEIFKTITTDNALSFHRYPI